MVAPPLLILATGAFATGWLAFRGASFTALWVGGASLAAASVKHSAEQRLMRRILCVVERETALQRSVVLVEAKSTLLASVLRPLVSCPGARVPALRRRIDHDRLIAPSDLIFCRIGGHRAALDWLQAGSCKQGRAGSLSAVASIGR